MEESMEESIEEKIMLKQKSTGKKFKLKKLPKHIKVEEIKVEEIKVEEIKVEENKVENYEKQLTADELIVLQIAREELQTSCSLEKSQGYLAWINKT